MQFQHLATSAIALMASAPVAAKTNFQTAPTSASTFAAEHATQGAN